MELAVAIIAGLICICGAIGVIGFRNPVHNALSLVATLFGVAVIFIAQGAYFLAAIQVIVYAGAIVVVFLFVIMLLGVDKVERLERFAVSPQQIAAVLAGMALHIALLGNPNCGKTALFTRQAGVHRKCLGIRDYVDPAGHCRRRCRTAGFAVRRASDRRGRLPGDRISVRGRPARCRSWAPR